MWGGEIVAVLFGGAGGAWVGVDHAERVDPLTALSASVAGVIIGGALAAMAIQVASLDKDLLRSVRAGRSLVDLLSHFIITVLTGIGAIFGLIVWTALSKEAPSAWHAVVGSWTGALTLWTIASLVPALGSVISLLELRQRAAAPPGGREQA